MIFINTRPVDENAHCDRRPSKAPSHSGHSVHQKSGSPIVNLSLSLMLFYVLVSIFPCILFYPISLISILIPLLALFFALCTIRSDSSQSQWPILFIAVIGILLKIAAIIVYISLFPLKNRQNRFQTGSSTSLGSHKKDEINHYRTVFYLIVAFIELLIFIIGIFLKWQLISLEEREKKQKRRSTLLSTHSLSCEDGSIQRRSYQP